MPRGIPTNRRRRPRRFNYSLLLFAIVIGYLVFGSTPDLHTVLGATRGVAAGRHAFTRGDQGAGWFPAYCRRMVNLDSLRS